LSTGSLNWNTSSGDAKIYFELKTFMNLHSDRKSDNGQGNLHSSPKSTPKKSEDQRKKILQTTPRRTYTVQKIQRTKRKEKAPLLKKKDR